MLFFFFIQNCPLQIFLLLKLTFSMYSFWNTIKLFNSLDSDQTQHFVWPDLGPNCLQKLSTDDKSQLAGKELRKTIQFTCVVTTVHICN